MFKTFGLLFTLVSSMCLVGCGGSGGGNMIEDAEQSDIEAYEASLAEEEAAMDADFEETP